MMATALLTAEEEFDLAVRSKQGDKSARDELIRRNFPLAWSHADRWQGSGLDREDLRQEAVLGLIEGVDRFDPARGWRLSTYAFWWIRRRVREAALARHMIHIPHQSGADPIEVGEMPDSVRARGEGIGEDLERRDCRTVLLNDVLRLEPRQMTVVALFYGLDGEPPWSIRKIARHLRLSQFVVTKLHRRALDLLGEMSAQRRYPRTGPRAEHPPKCDPTDRTPRSRRPAAKSAGSSRG